MDFKQEFAEMAEKVASGTTNAEGARVLILAQEHFNHKRDQLQMVLSNKEASIRLGDDDDDDPIEIEAGTDMHKGFMVGISIALHIIGQFPITICEHEEDEDA